MGKSPSHYRKEFKIDAEDARRAMCRICPEKRWLHIRSIHGHARSSKHQNSRSLQSARKSGEYYRNTPNGELGPQASEGPKQLPQSLANASPTGKKSTQSITSTKDGIYKLLNSNAEGTRTESGHVENREMGKERDILQNIAKMGQAGIEDSQKGRFQVVTGHTGNRMKNVALSEDRPSETPLMPTQSKANTINSKDDASGSPSLQVNNQAPLTLHRAPRAKQLLNRQAQIDKSGRSLGRRYTLLSWLSTVDLAQYHNVLDSQGFSDLSALKRFANTPYEKQERYLDRFFGESISSVHRYLLLDALEKLKNEVHPFHSI